MFDITLGDIWTAYYDCRKHKRNTRNALEFELNVSDNLYELWDDIRKGTYEIGRSITFVVTKPKPREVFAADFRDRIVHHLVIRKLEPFFEEYFIDDAYNCRKGKGTLYGIKRLQEKLRQGVEMYGDKCYVARFDNQGFFMSIHKPTLWKKLETFINERYPYKDKELMLWLAHKIVMHCPQNNCRRKSPIGMWKLLSKDKSLFTVGSEYGLPIGNLSSQVFANFYLSEFDLRMASAFLYGRYVDDFYLIGLKKQILSAISHMRRDLSLLHIKLHPRKWYLQHYTKGIAFTGSVVFMGRIYTGNRMIGAFEDSVLSYNSLEDKKSNVIHLRDSMNSYIGHMKSFNAYRVKKHVLGEIDSSWYKFMYIYGHYDKIVVRKKAA